MNLLMQVFDRGGAARGDIRLNLDFGSPARWTLVEDSGGVWPTIGSLQDGEMDVSGTEVAIKGQPPGQLPQPVLFLPENPESSIYGGGVGTVVASSDPSLVGGDVYWSRELSAIRQAMRAVLDEFIPRPVISSDDPEFQKLTGYNTKRLMDEKWEPENARPPWPEGKMPKKDTGFTCCNMTVGALAVQLGLRLGKNAGFWLSKGVLQLDWADRDVHGSWVPSSSGRSPQAGDFYASPGEKQPIGHVGTIGELQDGLWVAYDGGQGGYGVDKHDYIKKVPRGRLEPSRLKGWVDIDIYFK